MSTRYEDKEEEFLEAMATRFEFYDKTRLVFLKRFSEQYAELNDKSLAEEYERDLVAGTREKPKLVADAKEKSKAAIVLRDHLEKICDKLGDEGCDFNGATKGRWKIAKRWLREVIFPQWLKKQQALVTPPPFTIDEIWQQLKAKANDSNLLEVVVVEVSTMGARRKKTCKTVPVNSDIQYQVKVEREGYLILLEREPSGVVCCLCPSEYAPNSRCAAGVMVLPQCPPSEYATFGSDEVGREQILALITQELPPLDWLEKSKDEALELDRDHLYGLLEYVEGNRDCQVFWTEYSVV
ncbi:DUF4384 domain-containing protein [Aerosakkonema funiforme]|uniref:DUF4384 domain-containing protein n=1 Tax=Aerosakkonema funiforme TaxID=1246630 RepID=UPI0035B7E5FE